MASQRMGASTRQLSLGDALPNDEISPVQRSSATTSPTWHDADDADDADEWSVELAVDVLDAVSRNTASTGDAFTRRTELVQRSTELAAGEASAWQQQQLAYIEHMHATIHTLHAELERYQQTCRSLANGAVGSDTEDRFTLLPSPSTAGQATKRPAISTALMRSPLAARVVPTGSRSLHFGGGSSSPSPSKDRAQDWTNVFGRSAEPKAGRTNASFLPELEPTQRELHAAAKLISTREGKLKEILREKAHWEKEYQLMREQVVAEKMRQVELFHRLEAHKREHAHRSEQLERALREAQHENELLKSQLSEARVKLSHQRNTLNNVLRLAKDEKESLVCTIAETRHKFKEWKDGEASTLKAARDQAVHTLKTEYELKIARHHSEKQKLRDKVKDLEVSLRLLQKDRHLSPQELSLRKATILGCRDTGATAEAELIEAHCRIKELEALLDHAKEYQKRQENIIRMSEATIVKLEQEREVVALEHATLLQPLATMSSTMDAAAPSSPTAGPKLTRRSSKMTQGNEANNSRPAQTRFSAGNASMLTPNQPPSSNNFKSPGGDAEKELLRRQSIVLSAEVEKYRHMVVQSLDEIRTLRDNRRRSLVNNQGSSGTNSANLASAREQYLMNELFKVQKELDEMKEESRQRNRSVAKVSQGEKEDKASSSSDSSDDSESDSDSDCASEDTSQAKVQATNEKEVPDPTQVAAVTIIQKRSKGFIMRRDFIKKKRAIDKIKAQYRGYLVRKNMELLDLTHRPFIVTDAIQVKMQIVDVHYELDKLCGNKPVRLVLRVSKDPPVVQILLQELLPDTAVPTKIYYFHLFEIVALLPMDDETSILEKSSPKDIAQTIGSLLQVVSVAGELKFVINRSSRRRQDGANVPPLLPAVTGSYLTQLHVQRSQEPEPANEKKRSGSTVGSAVPSKTDCGVDNLRTTDEDNDLDTLIRLSRCPSTHLSDVAHPPIERPLEDPEYGTVDVGGNGTPEFEFTSRLVMRRASTLLPPVHEKP